MNFQRLVSGAAILAFAATLSAADVVARYKIPFAFTVGDQELAAGSYTIERGPGAATAPMVVVRDSEGKVAAMFTTFFGERPRMENKAHLYFNRYGDRYFLSQVFMPNAFAGHKLIQSRAEKEWAESKIRYQISRVVLTPETARP